jgi:hypothetical protein
MDAYLNIFGTDDHYFEILDALMEYGTEHTDIDKCFKDALALARQYSTINFDENKDEITKILFDTLEGFVFENLEDLISHRWEFNEFSTPEFLRLINSPLSDLSSIHATYIRKEIISDLIFPKTLQ